MLQGVFSRLRNRLSPHHLWRVASHHRPPCLAPYRDFRRQQRLQEWRRLRMNRTCQMREAPRQWRYWQILLRQRLSPPPTFVDEWWFQMSQSRLAPHQEAPTTPRSLPEANSTPVLPRSSVMRFNDFSKDLPHNVRPRGLYVLKLSPFISASERHRLFASSLLLLY